MNNNETQTKTREQCDCGANVTEAGENWLCDDCAEWCDGNLPSNNNEAVALSHLSDELTDWCKARGYPQMSADELADKLRKDVEWLDGFCDRWDAV